MLSSSPGLSSSSLLEKIWVAPVSAEDLSDHQTEPVPEEFLTSFEIAWKQFIKENIQKMRDEEEKAKEGSEDNRIHQHSNEILINNIQNSNMIKLLMGQHEERLRGLQQQVIELTQSKESVEHELRQQLHFFESSRQELEDTYTDLMREAVSKQQEVHQALSVPLDAVTLADHHQQKTLPWLHFIQELDRVIEENGKGGKSEKKDEVDKNLPAVVTTALSSTSSNLGGAAENYVTDLGSLAAASVVSKGSAARSISDRTTATAAKPTPVAAEANTRPSDRAMFLLTRSAGKKLNESIFTGKNHSADLELRARRIDHALLSVHVNMLNKELEGYEKTALSQEFAGKFLTEHNVWSILKLQQVAISSGHSVSSVSTASMTTAANTSNPTVSRGSHTPSPATILFDGRPASRNSYVASHTYASEARPSSRNSNATSQVPSATEGRPSSRNCNAVSHSMPGVEGRPSSRNSNAASRFSDVAEGRPSSRDSRVTSRSAAVVEAETATVSNSKNHLQRHQGLLVVGAMAATSAAVAVDDGREDDEVHRQQSAS